MASDETRRLLEEERRKREWREMWEQIGRLTGQDTNAMVNLPEFGR